MTAKQRIVLGGLTVAQHEHDGDAVSAGRVADACPVPWSGRPDLVTAALVLLERDGMGRDINGARSNASCLSPVAPAEVMDLCVMQMTPALPEAVATFWRTYVAATGVTDEPLERCDPGTPLRLTVAEPEQDGRQGSTLGRGPLPRPGPTKPSGPMV